MKGPHMQELTPNDQLYAGMQMTRPLLRNITARLEADLVGTGISVGQRAILEVLLTVDHATAPQITKELQVTRQFVGREVKDLLEKGMLETVENPQHRSSKFYRLTANSRKVIKDIRTRETQNLSAFAACFTKDEIAAYYKIQSAMLRVLAMDGETPKQPKDKG